MEDLKLPGDGMKLSEPPLLTELINDVKTIKFPGKEVLLRLASFILIDIRLLFIVVAMYITICTAITTAANNEAADDAKGGRIFNISSKPEHMNLRISDVSNDVLWNCRKKSVTNQYYKVLYGSLFSVFVLILLVFIVTRMSVIFGNITSGLSHLNIALWNMQLLKYVRKKVKEKEVDYELLTWFIEEWNRKKHHNEDDKANKTSIRHCTMLLIPFFEALFLTIALPFMITTYDINPIGCIVGPDEGAIEYNNVTGKVKLMFTEGVLVYQRVALTISLVVMMPIALLAIMLPVHYYRITKQMAKNISAIN